MNILSLGCGVQSSTLYLMAHLGQVKIDHAIFADTGWEPKAVYEYLEYLQSFGSIPIHVVQKGNIRTDISKKRSASMPYFSKNGGMLNRQCTAEYKIMPVRKKVKQLKKGKVKQVNLLLGISLDEITRAKPSQVQYIQNTFPLLDMFMDRASCYKFIVENGFKMPPKSACIGCPFRSNDSWIKMREECPDEFKEAVEFDEKARVQEKFKEEVFLHRSCLPLDEIVELASQQDTMWDSFTAECEGVCGL